MIPNLDERDENDIFESIKKLAPFYVPEWVLNKENMEPGTVLSMLFSKMMEGTIERHNQVLQRNKTAFLNMLNAGQLPAEPAEAYVTFFLKGGAGEHVLIPKGTMVRGENFKGEEVDFETAQEMLATPAKPVCAYQTGKNAEYINLISPDIFEISKGEEKGFVLFSKGESANLQKHVLYIGDSAMFNITQSAVIYLKFENTKNRYYENKTYQFLSDDAACRWRYLSENDDGTTTICKFEKVLYFGDSLMLFKENKNKIAKNQLNGIGGYFILCRPKKKIEEYEDIGFDKVSMAVRYLDVDFQDGVLPDRMFFNDMELRLSDFYPFGTFFTIYNCFYISSQEVFSKKGSTITINFVVEYEEKQSGEPDKKNIVWKSIMKKKDFEEPKPGKVFLESVLWEYWNGKGWVRLATSEDCEGLFDYRLPREKTVVFARPSDMEKTPVNGQFDYYIRARAASVHNEYKPNSIYLTPKIKKIRLKYDTKSFQPVESMQALNNNTWQTYQAGGKIFRPFTGMENPYPSLYLGFDVMPVKGPIHLYFSLSKLAEPKQPVQQKQSIEPKWEYHSDGKWLPLMVEDRTGKFSSSGSVVFAGPSDFTTETFFGERKYWIRVSNKAKDMDATNIKVNGIFINTARVLQQESFNDVIPDILYEEADIQFRLHRYPFFCEEVYINEAGVLSEKEQTELIGSNKVFKHKRDHSGKITELWVKCDRVCDFSNSGFSDRHYIPDSASGRIILNSKVYGRSFFKGGQRIKVNFKIGGGSCGNVGAYAINRLKSSIAFVTSVINSDASFGGSDMESLEEACERKIQQIRHRNRAVTVEDIEALALSASRNVSKARCIPNCDENFREKTGCFTVVIFPRGETVRDDFFNELKNKVKRHIISNTSALVAFEDRISVTGPAFIDISVTCKVVVASMEGIIELETDIISKLNAFLNPQTGNVGNRGWNIGEHPHNSNFYNILKSSVNVKYIETLVVTLHEVRYGNKIEIPLSECDNRPNMMVRSGQHQINFCVLREGNRC